MIDVPYPIKDMKWKQYNSHTLHRTRTFYGDEPTINKQKQFNSDFFFMNQNDGLIDEYGFY